jgi:hypothetical protein
MSYINETENPQYYMAIRTAIWSIASNMETFSQIREYVFETNILSYEIKEYITNTDSETIGNDTMKFI